MKQISLALGLSMLFSPGVGQAAAPKALEPLSFLLGDWQGEGGGKPGAASGAFTFAAELQDRVIVRTNHADYPATADRPASRHDDLMVLYATEAGEIRADYYDNEGHVIRYSGTAAPGQLMLVGDLAGGGPRFRLTYKLKADGALDGSFEIAPPGKPDAFAPYLSWTSRRKGTGE